MANKNPLVRKIERLAKKSENLYDDMISCNQDIRQMVACCLNVEREDVNIKNSDKKQGVLLIEIDTLEAPKKVVELDQVLNLVKKPDFSLAML